jgi:hypothetical protein
VVGEVVHDEGFRVARGRTRVRRAQERRLVCGVVANARTNVPRDEYDRLKAILRDVSRRLRG